MIRFSGQWWSTQIFLETAAGRLRAIAELTIPEEGRRRAAGPERVGVLS
jgi:hypothetical protein